MRPPSRREPSIRRRQPHRPLSNRGFRDTTAPAFPENVDEAAATAMTTANAARDGVEGVDLDHEAVDLLRFQQAYEGSARIVQVARDILNTIMGLFK